ncbi:MAG: Lysophospholipase L1-like esterase [Acidobacteria bacterium]|nr:Lysophospholipase L1-like esterase [Acidobacteriota bacterium]
MRGEWGESGTLRAAAAAGALLALLAAGCSRAGDDAVAAREPATAPPTTREATTATSNGAASAPAGSSLPSMGASRSASSEGSGLAPAAAPLGADEPPLVVFLGDSLTAAFGLDEDQGYPARVAAELERRGLGIRAINAGISGDTSAGGLERLDWLLAQEPDLVVVELGANDGLRGQPLEAIEANLAAIVERSLAAGARVVVAGMKIPTNYGPEYTAGFEAIYPRVARRPGATLIPFLLDGVAARPELNLPDGIHPNARGYEVVAGTVAEALAPLLEELRAKPAA